MGAAQQAYFNDRLKRIERGESKAIAVGDGPAVGSFAEMQARERSAGVQSAGSYGALRSVLGLIYGALTAAVGAVVLSYWAHIAPVSDASVEEGLSGVSLPVIGVALALTWLVGIALFRLRGAGPILGMIAGAAALGGYLYSAKLVEADATVVAVSPDLADLVMVQFGFADGVPQGETIDGVETAVGAIPSVPGDTSQEVTVAPEL